jgi:methylated-DNA-[protein]-cysteine S-methyltransferase
MNMSSTKQHTTVESPVGPLTLIASNDRLVGLWFGDGFSEDLIGKRNDDVSVLIRVREQLDEYFAGTRLEFDLPLDPDGTQFQKAVWRQLCEIPHGVTISYRELAERVGNGNASRAVGLANGKNPTAIIVPCHRVIGANGKLVGYGGGLSRKIALLDFEAAVRATGPQPFPGGCQAARETVVA